MNVVRGYMEMAAVYFPQTSFEEMGGLGVHRGVLEKAEKALDEMRQVLSETPSAEFSAVLEQDTAEILLARHDLLGADTLLEAARHLALARDAANASGATLRIAHVSYLAARVASALLRVGGIEAPVALQLLEEGARLNLALGVRSRAGECIFWRALAAYGAKEELEKYATVFEQNLQEAFDLLASGRAFDVALQCLDVLFRFLWQRYARYSVALVADQYRAACQKGIDSVGSLYGYRGLFVAHFGAGLAVIAEEAEDPSMMAEALDCLRSAEVMLSEREQPMQWAQTILLRKQLSDRMGEALAEDVHHTGDLARARLILAEYQQRISSQPGGAELGKFVDNLLGGTPGRDNQLPEPKVPIVPVPRYLLESDFRKSGGVEVAIRLLDKARAEVVD